jgi:hypothetical protein
MLGVLGAGAAGLFALSGGAARAVDQHEGHIKAIGECAKLCNEASHHCLTEVKKGGPHADHHAKAHESVSTARAATPNSSLCQMARSGNLPCERGP